MLRAKSGFFIVLTLISLSAAVKPFYAHSAEAVEETGAPLDLGKLRDEFKADASRPDSPVECEECRINAILNNPEFMQYLKRSIEADTGLS